MPHLPPHTRRSIRLAVRRGLRPPGRRVARLDSSVSRQEPPAFSHAVLVEAERILRKHSPATGYGNPSGMRPRRGFPTETKPFFLTSEFVGSILAIAGLAITAASSDSFGAWRAWILLTAVTAAYPVSRGIAKSGTRSHASDPREQLDLNWGRRDSSDDHS